MSSLGANRPSLLPSSQGDERAGSRLPARLRAEAAEKPGIQYMDMSKVILVVDDEQKIVELCRDYLTAAGFAVIAAHDGAKGLALARKERPDLVVLDGMMPQMDGLDVIRELRRESGIPVIMLTARVEESDKLVGLELGADDYITKPFSPRELVARVRTVLRRAAGLNAAAVEVIRAGDLSLDRARYHVTRPEGDVALTPTEFEILAALASQPGRVFSRAQLLTVARGVSFESYERAVDSHIRNLRRKIEPLDGEPKYIITVHGIGYKFADSR
jgi:two-component system alkaline phosphatase synthesis response regulator PhoP